MTEAVKVITICGSLRKGSYNTALARLAPKLAPPGMAITPAPPIGDFPLYNFDIQSSTGIPESVNTLAAAIRAADGVLICAPEYNFSIAAPLKNAVDWLSRPKEQPFAGKPIALQSASGGLLGGSRMQYHLRQSLAGLDALLYGKPEVFVNFAAQKFDEKTLELKDQAAIDLITQQLKGFETFIRRWAGKQAMAAT
jgi:chromate reductase, NAD(P)H dehydrogenase (quinone)